MTPSTGGPRYTPYHPRWHRRRMPIFWWLGHVAYTRFILRELTSLAVAYAALLLMVQTWAASRGPDTFERLQEWLATPPAVVLHGAVLAALLLHAVTWLALAPKALVIRIGGRRVPDAVVMASHYFAWLATSAVLARVLLA